MRSPIDPDDHLMRQAGQEAETKASGGLVDTAPRKFDQTHSHKEIRDLRGKIDFHEGYDYKESRAR